MRIRARGLTLIEVIVAVSIFAAFAVAMLMVEASSNEAVVTTTRLADLRLRARRAMERLTAVTGQAMTNTLSSSSPQLLIGDPSALGPTGTTQQRLQFREVADTNSDGIPTVDEGRNIFILGPVSSGDPDNEVCQGVVILRSSTAGGSITECDVAKGADGVFGSVDDATSAMGVDRKPLCELLVPNIYAPRVGPMLTISLAGRVVTYTLRMNLRKRVVRSAEQTDATQAAAYELATDLVLTARVALNQ